MTAIILQIFYGTVFTVMIGVWSLQTLRLIAVRSSSKRLKWLRRMYWHHAREKILSGSIGNWKVTSYFTRYLSKSLAAKQHFINHGYTETRVILVGKVEELERFVEKYKYNTFDNLDWDEQDFIDSFEKKPKK